MAMVRGDLPHRVKRIHEQYGPVVRVAPDELSFTDPAAWRDIYPRNFIRPREYKDKPPGKDAENLVSASESDHGRFRKILAPAFSEKAIHEQEPVIKSYVDLLIQKLYQAIENSPSGNAVVVDVLEWFNYTTFDVIGDFIWGTPFGCLDQLRYHPWIQVIAQFKVALIAGAFKFYPPLDHVLELITPKTAMADLWMIWKTTEEKISQRLAMKSHRRDVISHMVAANEASSNLHITRDEIEINGMLLIIAGSESVTTVLTGIVNYLLREPIKLEILVQEIRSNFNNEDDITGVSVNHMPYLNAVIHEGLRLCPTIPDGMRRNIPASGAAVAGHFLPEGVTVSIPQWATYQSPSNFTLPTSFIPERWLADSSDTVSVYNKDRQDAFHPFSLGSHNCPGRTLAYLEMRLILAKLVWHFNMDIPNGMTLPDWERQKIYWFWEKSSTQVKFSRAR